MLILPSQKDTDDEVKEHVRQNLHLQDKVMFSTVTSVYYCYRLLIVLTVIVRQSDDPAVQWQLNLYKDVAVKCEEPANPEHTVDRVQNISAALFHLEQVKTRSW